MQELKKSNKWNTVDFPPQNFKTPENLLEAREVLERLNLYKT